METMTGTEAHGDLRSQKDAINQLVSQLSTGSVSSGPSSLSTDPSVSFNFACPVPAGEQEPGQNIQTQTTSSSTHFGDPSRLTESTSQQLSLWAHKRHSGKAQPAATSSEARNTAPGSQQQHSRRRSPVDCTAASSAWNAANSLQVRDYGLVEAGSSVWRGQQHHKGATWSQQAARKALHSIESRADSSASTSSRLHSRVHGPVGPFAATSALLHSRSSRQKKKPKARRLQSIPSTAHQRTPVDRRAPATMQRTVLPRCPSHLMQRGASRAVRGVPVTSNPVEEGIEDTSVEKMQELSRLLHQVILLHTGDGSAMSTTRQHLASCSSQMDSVELSSILRDAEQLMMQVRQSPSVATSMSGDPISSSMSYTPSITPSITQSRLTAREEATHSPPKLVVAASQPMVSSPDPTLERLAEGTTSMGGMSTPCCSSSHTGGTQNVDASAVASSPVAASASSLSSELSGMGESLELFLPAPLALPIAYTAQQDRSRSDSDKLQAESHNSPMVTTHGSKKLTGKSGKSHSGSLENGSGAQSSAPDNQSSVDACCKSPLFAKQTTFDCETPAISPSTPELMSVPQESASSMKQAASRWQRDAEDSSDQQSSTVPAEWQVADTPSCSGTGSSLEADRSTCEPQAQRDTSVQSSPAQDGPSEVRRQDTRGSAVPAHLRKEPTARKGVAVLPEGFRGKVPDDLLSEVLPSLSGETDRSAPVYVVPVDPQPQARGFTQRAAELWKSMFRKHQVPSKSCELSRPASRSPSNRERAAARLQNYHRSAQNTTQPACKSDETSVFCACF